MRYRWLDSDELRKMGRRYHFTLRFFCIPVHSIIVPARTPSGERKLSALTWKGLDARVERFLATQVRMHALGAGPRVPVLTREERAAARLRDPGARVRADQRAGASARARTMINS